MNNPKDDDKKQETEQEERISIELDDLDELSNEELMDLLNQLSDNGLSKKEKFLHSIKSFVIFLCKDLIISLLLVFMLNSFFNIIQSNLTEFFIYFGIYYIIDVIFNRYFDFKFPLIKLISFGIINFIITLLAFVMSGIICKQLLIISFKDFVICLVVVVIYVLIKNFVLRYMNKLFKKGKKNDSIN
jgi:hypothetical protein